MTTPADLIRLFLLGRGLLEVHTGSTWPAFISHMPAKPEQCFALMDEPAMKQGRLMRSGTVIEKKVVIIALRAKSFIAGYAKMQAVQDALDSLYQETITLTEPSPDEAYLINSITRSAGFSSIGAETGTATRLEQFVLEIRFAMRTVEAASVLSDFNDGDFVNEDFT